MAILSLVTNVSMIGVGAYTAFNSDQREGQRWTSAFILILAVVALIWDRRRLMRSFGAVLLRVS